MSDEENNIKSKPKEAIDNENGKTQELKAEIEDFNRIKNYLENIKNEHQKAKVKLIQDIKDSSINPRISYKNNYHNDQKLKDKIFDFFSKPKSNTYKISKIPDPNNNHCLIKGGFGYGKTTYLNKEIQEFNKKISNQIPTPYIIYLNTWEYNNSQDILNDILHKLYFDKNNKEDFANLTYILRIIPKPIIIICAILCFVIGLSYIPPIYNFLDNNCKYPITQNIIKDIITLCKVLLSSMSIYIALINFFKLSTTYLIKNKIQKKIQTRGVIFIIDELDRMPKEKSLETLYNLKGLLELDNAFYIFLWDKNIMSIYMEELIDRGNLDRYKFNELELQYQYRKYFKDFSTIFNTLSKIEIENLDSIDNASTESTDFNTIQSNKKYKDLLNNDEIYKIMQRKLLYSARAIKKISNRNIKKEKNYITRFNNYLFFEEKYFQDNIIIIENDINILQDVIHHNIKDVSLLQRYVYFDFYINKIDISYHGFLKKQRKIEKTSNIRNYKQNVSDQILSYSINNIKLLIHIYIYCYVEDYLFKYINSNEDLKECYPEFSEEFLNEFTKFYDEIKYTINSILKYKNITSLSNKEEQTKNKMFNNMKIAYNEEYKYISDCIKEKKHIENYKYYFLIKNINFANVNYTNQISKELPPLLKEGLYNFIK